MWIPSYIIQVFIHVFGLVHSISVNMNRTLSEQLKKEYASMILYAIYQCLFMAILYGVYCYYSFYSIKNENQQKVINQNLKVMIDCLDSTIISMTSENTLSYCNVPGIGLLKRVASSQNQLLDS